MGQAYYGSGRVEDMKRCYHNLLNRYGKGRYAAAAAYTLAADHFNNRQYALAAVLFEKLAQIATKPEERQRGNYYAGLCYELQGRSADASSSFQKVLSDEDPGNPYRTKSQFSLGRIFSKANKQEEALNMFDQVVNSQGTVEMRAEAAVQAGDIAAKLGQVDASDKYLLLVLNTPGMEASRPLAQTSLMSARLTQKRYKEVIDLYRKSDVKAVGEEEATRLMIAGKAYMLLGGNADALELFRQVERMNLPNESLAFEASFYRLVCFFNIQGNHVPEQVDAFLELYKKGHAKDPRLQRALLMKAESLLADKKTAEAAKAYAEIDISLVDSSYRGAVLYNRAYAMSDSGDPQGVIRSISPFIEDYPNDEKIPKALIMRAKAYTDTGELAKAIADYDRIVARKDDPELRSLAWMLSADIAKQQNNLDDMIARYRSFLEKANKPTDAQKAKANYWLAWGLVKKDKLAEALPLADAARKLDGKKYSKNAGQLLCLSLWSLQQPERLGDELDEAIKGEYVTDLPEALIRWAAVQAFSADRPKQAARFYALIVDPEEPQATPKDDWRNYGKALLDSGEPKKALGPINHALEMEADMQWKADGLLDKARAQSAIGDDTAALKTIDEGLALRPQGRVGFGLNILIGDIEMKKGHPRAAASAYVTPLEMMDDADRVGKPAVIQKIIKALEETKDGEMPDRQETLQRYRKMMDKFPDWKPTAQAAPSK
jgi:tetratricopeptide (TPR) repeat protein